MIVRHGSRRRWTVIDNGLVNDARLSFRAKGVAVYLLSKPDGWAWNRESLAGVGPDGEHAMRTAMNELAEYGYLVRTTDRDERGHIRTTLTIFECPDCDSPEEENRPAVPPGQTDVSAGGTGGRFTGGGEPPALVSTEGVSTTKTRAPDALSLLAEFDLWWKEYPRREGTRDKPGAQKNYLARRRARPPASAEDLLTAARQYALEREGADPTYTKGARGFLEKDGLWTEALDRARRGVRPEGGPPDLTAIQERLNAEKARRDAMTDEEREAAQRADPRSAWMFEDEEAGG